eukprot:jgi/Galph1/3794/GphlegSOOS_G2506.1
MSKYTPEQLRELKSLQGKTAIVTGSSRGIGRQIALTFAQAGANVVIAAKSVEDSPQLPGTIYSVAKEVEKFGVKALPCKVDVRDYESVRHLVKLTYFCRFLYISSNSSLKALWWKNVVDTPIGKYDLVQGVNARGSFACVHEVLPYMIKQRSGHILTMSPPIDLDHMEGKVGYLMSKYGMTILAMGLAEEVREFNISSNALWPKTMIESFATINFHLGERWMWRKASILADCVLMIVSDPGGKYSGHAIIDEDFMRQRGIHDFSRYQCVPGKEPPAAWPASKLGSFRPSSNVPIPPGIYSQNAASSVRTLLGVCLENSECEIGGGCYTLRDEVESIIESSECRKLYVTGTCSSTCFQYLQRKLVENKELWKGCSSLCWTETYQQLVEGWIELCQSRVNIGSGNSNIVNWLGKRTGLESNLASLQKFSKQRKLSGSLLYLAAALFLLVIMTCLCKSWKKHRRNRLKMLKKTLDIDGREPTVSVLNRKGARRHLMRLLLAKDEHRDK